MPTLSFATGKLENDPCNQFKAIFSDDVRNSYREHSSISNEDPRVRFHVHSAYKGQENLFLLISIRKTGALSVSRYGGIVQIYPHVELIKIVENKEGEEGVPGEIESLLQPLEMVTRV